MDRLETVSQVTPRGHRVTLHYARGDKTLCGRRVGRLGRWFRPLPWEPAHRLGAATCAACKERINHD